MKYFALFKIYKNKGFTIIELLVSLGVSSIVVVLIFSFFISNYNSYKAVSSESEIQFQAQYILNFMSNRIMDSNSISLVKADEVTYYSMTALRNAEINYPVKKISFKFGSKDSENYVFYISDKRIRYGNGVKDSKPSVELGNYVEEVYVSLLTNISFQNAKILKLTIVMEKDGHRYEAFQAAFMRNN